MTKKLFTVFLFISVFFSCLNGQFTHIGIAGGFGTGVKEPGFGFYGTYAINEQIRILPNFMYYLPHKITTDDGIQKFSWWIFNMDGNYIFLDQEAFQAYGLMGLSLIHLTGEQNEPPFEDKKYHYKMALNAGAGLRLPVSDKVIPFAEVKMALGDKAYFTFREISTTQLFVKAGILIRVAPDKERNIEEY